MIANQKFGIATPATEISVTTRSIAELRQTALAIPIGNAIRSATVMAIRLSWSETGMRTLSSLETVR